ncbi:MAG: acyl-CoA thioesterase [Gammaproteobacteria bacterium]|nr:acyl-CoA thioesterase [Gammaproteobacteria bacterium]
MPADTNAAGDIFGGWLMSQVDIAGSIEAHKFSNKRVVTVAVNEFIFLAPVNVGDILSLYTSIIRQGKTSVRVHIDGYIERKADTLETIRVTEAEITYVAIDLDGKPVLI